MVVRGSFNYPKLDTKANPIVVKDEHAPFSLASNPLVIEVNKG